jgi:predicted secreted protein
MASSVFNGTNLVLKLIADGGTLEALGHSTSCSMTITHDLPEATTKDSSGFQEVISGLRSAEISFDGLIDYTDAGNSLRNVDGIASLITGRNKIDWSFGTATTGDTVFTGEGFIASLEQTAEMESAATYSGTITVTGTITQSTN